MDDLLYILYFLIYLCIGIIIIQYIDREENGRLSRKPLGDKIHTITEELFRDTDNNILLSVIDGLLYLVIGLAIYVYVTKDRDSILVKEFLPPLLILFYFRILCIWVTELPSSMRHNKRSYLNPVTIDHMFSGHTMFMMSFLFYINIFYPLYAPTIMFILIYTFTIIVSREHYSIDVLVSMALTYSIFSKFITI